MRRFTAIARTAAIETMSQPLSAILFPVAVLAIHLLPAFQYHRFGAAGRLARETGLSALFVFGLFFAVPAVVRVIGRELETGTAAAALALGVSRSLYFMARLTGSLVVFLLFLFAVAAAKCVTGDVIPVSKKSEADKTNQRPSGFGTGASAKLVPVSDVFSGMNKVVGGIISAVIYH